jgi:hypothetical protein
LKLSAITAVSVALTIGSAAAAAIAAGKHGAKGRYNGELTGERFNRVAFPMGGMGAGMICIKTTGALSHFSVRLRPEVFNEPCTFAAVCVKGKKILADCA